MKRGVEEIVAVVLLVAISVIAGVSIYFWTTGLATKQPTPETPTPIVANPIPGGKVLIANLGQRTINASTIKTSSGNISCPNKDIAPGEQVLCTVNATGTVAIYGQGTGGSIVTISNETQNQSTSSGSGSGSGSGQQKPWYYPGWQYRLPINITERSGNNLDNYQIKIDLSSSNFNFSHAKDDGSDVRFTWVNASSEEEAIPYWIEYWNATEEKARVWVKVPSIPANGIARLYMYYGNTSAQSESNGGNVFKLFDDFNGNDINTTMWTEKTVSNGAGDGTYTVSNGILDIKGPSVYVHGGVGLGVFSKEPFGVNTAIRAYVTKENNYNGRTDDLGYSNGHPTIWTVINDKNYTGWYGGTGSGSNGPRSCHETNCNESGCVTLSVDCFTPPTIMEIRKLPDKTILDINGSDYVNDEYIPNDPKNISIFAGGGWADRGRYAEIAIDWIAAREYLDPEPFAGIGEEETP